jgi:hypothetical protein
MGRDAGSDYDGPSVDDVTQVTIRNDQAVRYPLGGAVAKQKARSWLPSFLHAARRDYLLSSSVRSVAHWACGRLVTA